MEHRQVWKNSLYEPSARVPFIVSGPGVAQGKVIAEAQELDGEGRAPPRERSR